MFRPVIAQCIDCPKGKKSLLVVRAMRCAKHNYEFKERNKSPGKLAKEKSERQRKFTKASGYKLKPRKTTGEKEVFERIWLSRLHRCEVCTRPITRKKNSVDIFSHILSKGADPVLRLDEDFILLMGDGYYGNCSCHRKWETRTKNMQQMEMWKPIFLLLDEAKKKAHQLRKNKPLYSENQNTQSHLGCTVQ